MFYSFMYMFHQTVIDQIDVRYSICNQEPFIRNENTLKQTLALKSKAKARPLKTLVSKCIVHSTRCRRTPTRLNGNFFEGCKRDM